MKRTYLSMFSVALYRNTIQKMSIGLLSVVLFVVDVDCSQKASKNKSEQAITNGQSIVVDGILLRSLTLVNVKTGQAVAIPVVQGGLVNGNSMQDVFNNGQSVTIVVGGQGVTSGSSAVGLAVQYNEAGGIATRSLNVSIAPGVYAIWYNGRSTGYSVSTSSTISFNIVPTTASYQSVTGDLSANNGPIKISRLGNYFDSLDSVSITISSSTVNTSLSVSAGNLSEFNSWLFGKGKSINLLAENGSWQQGCLWWGIVAVLVPGSHWSLSPLTNSCETINGGTVTIVINGITVAKLTNVFPAGDVGQVEMCVLEL